MGLVERPAGHGGHGDSSVCRKGYSVEPGHHRVGVGYPLVHARRPGATQQHLAVRQPITGLEENPAHLVCVGRLEGSGFGIKGLITTSTRAVVS